MRLIDADAIPWTDLNDNNPNSDLKVLVTFADKINMMPTIEERKKGKWRCVSKLGEVFKGYRCSECAELVYGKTNYCPNCGADMRGVEA